MNTEQNARAADALEKIQAAQNLVLDAAQDLSVVEGMAPQWQQTCKLYDSVKRHWHRVEQRRQALIRRRQRTPNRKDEPCSSS